MGVAGQRLTTWSRAPQREASSLKELAMMTPHEAAAVEIRRKVDRGRAGPGPPQQIIPRCWNIISKIKLKSFMLELYMSPESGVCLCVRVA